MKRVFIVDTTKQYEEVYNFTDLERYGIKVGKAYLTFNHGVHKVKIYYKNKFLSIICNKLNYEYGFGILCLGVYMYTHVKDNGEDYVSPKVNNNRVNQIVGVYGGNRDVKVSLSFIDVR